MIDAIEVFNFINRHLKTIAAILLVFLVTALAYTITRPTIYQSKVTMAVGERLYFLRQQQQQQQIESFDGIVYRYSKSAIIKPVKYKYN